jgi:hypothetical protein
MVCEKIAEACTKKGRKNGTLTSCVFLQFLQPILFRYRFGVAFRVPPFGGKPPANCGGKPPEGGTLNFSSCHKTFTYLLNKLRNSEEILSVDFCIFNFALWPTWF